MSISFIHTGDVHIGLQFKKATFSSKFAAIRRNEIKETFFQIINQAKQNKVDFLFISGDLFEENYITIGDLKEIKNKFLQIIDTNIVIIAGNHDPIINELSSYNLIKWPKNVYIFKKNNNKFEFPEKNTVIWGISWNKKEIKESLVEKINIEDKNKINVLLVHGDIYNVTPYLPINKKNLLVKGFDYVALGHIHKQDFISNNIAYCGSLEPLDFGETGEHGIIEGVISKEISDIKFKPICKRLFIKDEIKIDENMTFSDILDKIKKVDLIQNRKRNIYRIIIKGIKDRDLVLDLNKIIENLESEFFYVELCDETIEDYDIEKLQLENKDNIIGIFIEEMKRKGLDKEVNKKALYIGLEVLLNSKLFK